MSMHLDVSYLVIHAGSVRPRPRPRPMPPPSSPFRPTARGASPFGTCALGGCGRWCCISRYCSSVIHAGLFVPIPRPRPIAAPASPPNARCCCCCDGPLGGRPWLLPPPFLPLLPRPLPPRFFPRFLLVPRPPPRPPWFSLP